MRIAINTSPLSGGHTKRGIGGYTKHLIEALQLYQPEHTYFFIDSSGPFPKEAELIHYPFFDPFFLTLPIYSPRPAIVTVHDLIPILFPQHFPKGVRGSIKWEIQKYALLRKERIITDSNSSKEDIQKIIGIKKDDIDVIPLASSLRIPEKKSRLENMTDRFGVHGEYFLYVGDVNWNKNIPGLLAAFASYKEHTAHKDKGKFVSLVLVGKAFLDEGLKETQEINRLCERYHIKEDVIRTGYVHDEDLVELYARACALIQPSFYEGFGFPVLEALSCGCPVICANTSSLKEIAGPSFMVDPANFQSLAHGMRLVTTMNKKAREKRIAEGFEWAKQYTWKKVADHTIRSYEKVLGKI